MDTKLTLKLNKEVIEKAKKYALSQKKSLSGLVESYLESLTGQQGDSKGQEIEISPFVRSISTGVSIPSDIDYKADYLKHVEKKHQ